MTTDAALPHPDGSSCAEPCRTCALRMVFEDFETGKLSGGDALHLADQAAELPRRCDGLRHHEVPLSAEPADWVPPPDDWAGDLYDHEAVAHSGLIDPSDY